MASPAGTMKVVGIRELFDQVNRNNEGVKDLGLAGTVDDLIYVRIRGKVVAPTGESRLAWGAGPISGWDRFRKAKMVSKPGEYSTTFKAIYDLVVEIKPGLTTDEFKRQLKGKQIDIDHRWADIEDIKTICEVFDPEYVTYKGGRKPPRSDRLECIARREFADMTINLDQKHDTKHLEDNKSKVGPAAGKRNKLDTNITTESVRH